MTINTIGNAKDDVSVYNGDENHKVWAGSQDNLDGIYDVYSASSTMSRPQRPRQVQQPVAVPPPPPTADKEKKKKKKEKQLAKSLAGSREDLYHPLMNGKASSVAGTMMKPRAAPQQQQMPPHGAQPVYIVSPPHLGTLPNPKFFKYGGKKRSTTPRNVFYVAFCRKYLLASTKREDADTSKAYTATNSAHSSGDHPDDFNQK